MEVKASLKNLRISPYKVRLVADLVRGQSVEEALRILKLSPQRAVSPISKLIDSAVANAKDKASKVDLIVKAIKVDEAQTLKRSRFASRGRVVRIRKRGSHVSLILDLKERVSSKEQGIKSQKSENKI